MKNKKKHEIRFEQVRETLEKLLELFCNLYGRTRNGIEILCEEGQENPSCVENKIYLPNTVGVLKSKEKNFMLYSAFLLHEFGHIVFGSFLTASTQLERRVEIIEFALREFNILPNFNSVSAFRQRFSPMLFTLVNIFEDIRCDSILYETFPGYKEIDKIFFDKVAFKKSGNVFNAILVYLRLRKNTFLKQDTVLITILDDFIKEVQNGSNDLSLSLLYALKIYSEVKRNLRIREEYNTHKLFVFSAKWHNLAGNTENNCTTSSSSKQQQNNSGFGDEEEPYKIGNLYPPKTVRLVSYRYHGEPMFSISPSENNISPFSNNDAMNNTLRSTGTYINSKAVYAYLVAGIGNLEHNGKIFRGRQEIHNLNLSTADACLTFLLDASRSMTNRESGDKPFERAIDFLHNVCQQHFQTRILIPRDLGDEVEIEEAKKFSDPYQSNFGMQAPYACGFDVAATLRFLSKEINDVNDKPHIIIVLTDSTSHIFRRGYRDREKIIEHCQGCIKKRCPVEPIDFRTTFASERSRWKIKKHQFLTEHPDEETRLVKSSMKLLPSNAHVLWLPCDTKTKEQSNFWDALAPNRWACIGEALEPGLQLLKNTIELIAS